MKLLSTFILMTLLMTSACSQPKTYEEQLSRLYRNTVPKISTDTVQQQMDQFVLLDTREAEEFAVSHVPNALHVGYDDFDLSKVAHLPKDTKLVLYCSVGYRSERVGEQLQEAGYQHVYNMYGGIFQWFNERRPVTDAQGDTVQKVHTYNADWGQWVTRGEKVH